MKNTSFKPSKYQQAFFDWMESAIKSKDSKAAIIQAVAGSGKTTTIVEALNLIPSTARVLFLAFNKSIALELQSRVPKHVVAKTFNATGHGAWSFFMRNKWLKIDGNKVRNLLRETLLSPEDFDLYGGFVANLVSKAKGAGLGYLVPDVPGEWHKLIEHYDLNLDSEDAEMNRAIEIAQEALQESIRVSNQLIDFDDQLYMPLIRNVSFFQNDYVFVDEWQDTNAVQMALLKRMLKPGGKLVLVGDKRQAIYGFRGASSDAMEKAQEMFGAIMLPLSICYRCSKSVVRAAQKYVPEIECSDNAPEGKVAEVFDSQTFLPTDAVICRNTAPLVQLAYKLIARGVGCKVLGREIGEGLVALIEKMKAKGIDKLIAKLDAYKTREIAKLTSKGQEEKAGTVEDKIDCITVIIGSLDENCRTIPALIAKVRAMFADKQDKFGKVNPEFVGILTLMTAHKSKGLEFERVFILDAHRYMPSKWARQEWQKEQERNLIYVAITRAKVELYWLNSEGFEQKALESKSAMVTLPSDQKGQESNPSAKEMPFSALTAGVDSREAFPEWTFDENGALHIDE